VDAFMEDGKHEVEHGVADISDDDDVDEDEIGGGGELLTG